MGQFEGFYGPVLAASKRSYFGQPVLKSVQVKPGIFTKYAHTFLLLLSHCTLHWCIFTSGASKKALKD